MDIKLIALDLDGTLLTDSKSISKRNEIAVKMAMEKGIEVVIATGRSYSALPHSALEPLSLNYAITSNGANVVACKTRRTIFSSYIDKAAIEQIWSYLLDQEVMTEVFYDGNAYVSNYAYNNMAEFGVPTQFQAYVKESRTEVNSIEEFIKEHQEKIENINLLFATQEKRVKVRDELSRYKDVTITSSLGHNVEIGGKNTSKAKGIEFLCVKFNIPREAVLACGDNDNDISMLEYAGIGVSMGDGTEGAQKVADFISEASENDGVAMAIEKFVLNKR